MIDHPLIDLSAVPGVVETELGGSLLDSLPAAAPPAPWDCACEAVVWMSRPAAAAADAGPELAGRNLLVMGGFVRYLDTPVGPYSEVLGSVGVLQGRRVTATVPFMAVDSRDSLVGGRQNWSLPKTLASFTGSPLAGAVTARGEGWSVRADVRAVGPFLPIRMKGRLAQYWPDGALRTSLLRGDGRLRPAVVNVAVQSEGPLAGWLRPGRHVGAVLRSAQFHLSEAR